MLYPRSVAADASNLLTLSSFEALLATLNRAHEGWLHLARGGVRPVPPDMVDAQGMLKLQRIRAAFAGGDTLYLTKAERIAPPLMHLARAVEIDLAAHGIRLRQPVNAHVFLTPPGAQGFRLHRDEHASFVIQLDGCKEWTVYEPSNMDPSGEVLRPGAVDPATLRGVRQHTFALQRGDVLYMPEWWPHEATAAGAHSLHLTVRLFPLRWVDVVSEVCAAHPALAHSLPPATSGDPGELFDSLLRMLDSPCFRSGLPRLISTCVNRGRALDVVLPDDGLRQIVGLDRIDLQTPLVRCAGATCRLFESGDKVGLEFPGGIVRAAASLKPVFAFLVDAMQLRPQDLPEIPDADYDRVAVARTLVKDGLLRVAHDA